MHSRFAACVAAAALAIAVGAARPALAQEKTFELKLSHWVPASHPLQKALEDWGAAVEKESGGTLHYKVYPAQQLGKAYTTIMIWRTTALPILPTSIPVISPAASRSLPPANCRSSCRAPRAARRGLDAWYRKYAAKEMKDVKFCLAFIHAPSLVPFEHQEDSRAR